jgi:hypothetical protein
MFGRTDDIKIECGQLDDYDVEELLREYEPYKNTIHERMMGNDGIREGYEGVG